MSCAKGEDSLDGAFRAAVDATRRLESAGFCLTGCTSAVGVGGKSSGGVRGSSGWGATRLAVRLRVDGGVGSSTSMTKGCLKREDLRPLVVLMSLFGAVVAGVPTVLLIDVRVRFGKRGL